MGVPLPCFGYVTASGMPGVYEDRSSSWNKKNEQCVENFMCRLNKVDVSNIKNKTIEWNDEIAGQKLSLVEVYFETDVINRPELKKLIAKIGNQGTIVVPSIDHIFETDKITAGMIRNIVDNNIAILGIRYNVKFCGSGRNVDLTKIQDLELANQVIRSILDIRSYASKFFNGKSKKSKSSRV